MLLAVSSSPASLSMVAQKYIQRTSARAGSHVPFPAINDSISQNASAAASCVRIWGMPRQQPNWLRTSGGRSARANKLLLVASLRCVRDNKRLKTCKKGPFSADHKNIHNIHPYISEEKEKQRPSWSRYIFLEETWRNNEALSGNRSCALC